MRDLQRPRGQQVGGLVPVSFRSYLLMRALHVPAIAEFRWKVDYKMCKRWGIAGKEVKYSTRKELSAAEQEGPACVLVSSRCQRKVRRACRRCASRGTSARYLHPSFVTPVRLPFSYNFPSSRNSGHKATDWEVCSASDGISP